MGNSYLENMIDKDEGIERECNLIREYQELSQLFDRGPLGDVEIDEQKLAEELFNKIHVSDEVIQ